MSFELKDLKEHNSDLLNLLTQHLPDMLWVKDLNGIYSYANKAICDNLLMAKDTQEPIGKGDVFFAMREREAHKDKPDWHTFGELCFNSDQVVIDNDEPMKFEEYGNIKGKLVYLEVYKAPFYDKNGKTIGTVGAGRDITKLKTMQLDLEKNLKLLEDQRQMLEYQANHDSLTNLPNRVLFMDRLEQSIEVSKRNNKLTAVIFMDLDHFKEINDSLGHNIGDKVLVEASLRMREKMRKSDTLSRLGGDEFCVILNDLEHINNISEIIQHGMDVFKKPFIIDNSTLHVSMSVGVSVYPYDGTNANELLKNADAAMYKAKELGRNTFSFYDEEMTKKAFEKVFLETELRKAFKNDELLVYYQPQINALTNKMVGMEALARWQHSTMGFIMPSRFIPLAENNGMIIELDRIIMKKSITQFASWRKNYQYEGKLSINLTIKQIETNDLITFIKETITEADVPFNRIEFEVTESQIMNDPESSIAALKEISKLGISLAIDDFGTGYSSLSYLKKLPIHKLKVDKSFIDNLPHDAEDAAISKTVINLCENLNLQVIAEGVETDEQKKFLLENNCNYIQGYLFSRPLSVEDMQEYLSNS